MKNDYYIVEDEVFVYLRNIDDFTVISLSDLKIANRTNRRWYGKFDPKMGSHYVAVGRVENGKTKKILLHRLLLGLEDSKVHVDHKDHDTLNNRRSNLEAVTPSQNMQNRKHLLPSSGFKGVKRVGKSGRWQAQISIGRKSRLIGYFNTPEEAHAAYITEKEKVHKYWAKLRNERGRSK